MGSVRLLERAIPSVIQILELEFGLVQKLGAQTETADMIIVPWCFQLVLRVLEGIVRNEMMLYTFDRHRHGFFQEALLFELIRIHQRSHQSSISIPLCAFVGSQAWRLGREGSWILVLGRRTRGWCRIRFAHFVHPLTPLRRSLLLSWWERAVQLPVDEKVGKDPAGTPWDAVGPTLDP